jgi:hypothetical protein
MDFTGVIKGSAALGSETMTGLTQSIKGTWSWNGGHPDLKAVKPAPTSSGSPAIR